MMEIPETQTLLIFEQYESNGSLLHVTSDLSELDLEQGDLVIRRMWMTCDKPVEVKRA